jgi:hypothetical protein
MRGSESFTNRPIWQYSSINTPTYQKKSINTPMRAVYPTAKLKASTVDDDPDPNLMFFEDLQFVF